MKSTLFLCLFCMVAHAEGDYQLLRKTVLGGEGGWDYLTMDSAARRLYIPRGTHVMVVDADSTKVIHDIPNIQGAHGVEVAPDLNKGFTSNGRSNSITVFDLTTFKTLATVPVTGELPDSILYDSVRKHVWVFNHKTANATIIDAKTHAVLQTVKLSGAPETPVLDGHGNLFVNIEDKNELAQVDTKTFSVIRNIKLDGCNAPTGLAFDPKTGHLFVSCADNKKLLVVDSHSHKTVTSFDIGEGTDGAGFDPVTKLIFASCREGVLSIMKQVSASKYEKVADIKTERGARTMALDLKTHHVFVVTADFGPPKTPTAENPHPWPTILPGTFRLLEYGQ